MEQPPVPPIDELLAFFKALSDSNRLKIIGLLANQPTSVEQLAAQLNIGESTVSHHLSKLSETGLVSARADGYFSIYKLETARLEEMSKRILNRETLAQIAPEVAGDAVDRKVLRDYSTPDGRIPALPAKEKKLLIILRHMIQAFELDRRYSEKEVNEIILRYNDDFASIRRYFIVFKMMARENNQYWRI
jgi:predicted transcriptional regulator